jgi:hypothetical protein
MIASVRRHAPKPHRARTVSLIRVDHICVLLPSLDDDESIRRSKFVATTGRHTRASQNNPSTVLILLNM